LQWKSRTGKADLIVSSQDAETILERAARLPLAERERLRLRAIEFRAENRHLPARAERVLSQLIGALADATETTRLEARLVEKLALAGQLRSGYLLRALEQKRLGLFAQALARLGCYDPREVIEAISSPDRPELLALSLAGVGVDRSAFSTILTKVRALNGALPGGGEESARRAMGAFAQVSPQVAAEAFRRAASAV
jgi:uncharacterized protein (DUF2336 family)